MLALIFQIVKHGIYGLALLANRVFHVFALRHAVLKVNKVEEVASIGKTVLHKTLDNAMPHVYQLLIAMCLTPLYLVKALSNTRPQKPICTSRAGLQSSVRMV